MQIYFTRWHQWLNIWWLCGHNKQRISSNMYYGIHISHCPTAQGKSGNWIFIFCILSLSLSLSIYIYIYADRKNANFQKFSKGQILDTWHPDVSAWTEKHCALVTPYGDIDLGQHRLRQWLVPRQHHAITWTNFDFSLVRYSPKGNFTVNVQATFLYDEFENSLLEIIVQSLSCQWVKTFLVQHCGQCINAVWLYQ